MFIRVREPRRLHSMHTDAKMTHWTSSMGKLKVEEKKNKPRQRRGGFIAMDYYLFRHEVWKFSFCKTKESSRWTNDVVWRVYSTFFHWNIYKRYICFLSFIYIHSCIQFRSTPQFHLVSFCMIALRPTWEYNNQRVFQLEIHHA